MTGAVHPILIVDDDDDVRQTLTELLEDEGYKAVGAGNGVEALQQLQRSPLPCVILLDLTMPVMDGLQFREEQIRDGRLSAIPVVVITAGGRLGKTPPLGMPVMTKPFDIDALLGLLRLYC